jgi:hypothetical protein
MSHEISLEGSQNGTIRIDANTGWILGTKLNLTTSQKVFQTENNLKL